MSDKNNGGQAFPTSAIWPEGSIMQEGMTLRQWYAGMAMQGMLSNESVSWLGSDDEVLVKCAFRISDFMIKYEEEGK